MMDRQSGCLTKRAHLSRTDALVHAREHYVQHRQAKGVYRCPYCRCWHVGGRARGQVREIIRAAR